MLNVAAPNFSLPNQDGQTITLKDFSGKWLVLYFYPKDETPGCTKEACSFRDSRADIEALGAEVVGINADSPASHKKFSKKYHLNFPLLSDSDHQVIEAYKSWKPKKIFGKEILGVQRNTYIINPESVIVKSYEGVDPINHVDQIIDDLKSLMG